MDKRIVVIGAGPTGIGAGVKLHELDHPDWVILERSDRAGGLATSVVDQNGFVWDMGCHVIYSHYQYFNDVIDTFVSDWLLHKRECYIWCRNKFVPYPFQKNIHYLPEEDLHDCLQGIITAQTNRDHSPKPATFQDWIDKNFGYGLAKIFLNPYNYKVWGYRPAAMTADWVGERVATIDVKSIIQNINDRKEDASWGPNATFRFPLFGGTGAIWQQVYDSLPGNKRRLNEEVHEIDVENKHITMKSGEEIPYDYIINTMPLDILIDKLQGDSHYLPVLKEQKNIPWHSSTHIVGLGLEGKVPNHLSNKCWLYFPEDNCEFYRVTILSNYSPHTVPKPGEQWSLLFEICETEVKPVRRDVVQATIDGAINVGLISPNDSIISKWHKRLEYGYPTPFLTRTKFLDTVQPLLKSMGIYSRGRFGGWKYEVGNQDHSMMQGVEAVNNIVLGLDEETYFHPHVVNSTFNTTGRARKPGK